VTVENNSLLKRMNEIKQKKKALLPDIETKKLSKTGSMTKRTLNIDQRIRNIKQIMKENEVIFFCFITFFHAKIMKFLEKRLQTVSSTIDLKKIQNGFESNLKHSGNISKFSRRTVNGFIGAKPLKTPQTPSKPKTKAQQSQHSSSSSPKIQQLNPTLENNITNDKTETNRKKDDLLNEKIENHQETEEKQTKLTDVGSIAESKTLEELLKKQEISNLDVKQSGLFISERIDNGNIVMTGNLNQSSALQVNIEKSMKIE